MKILIPVVCLFCMFGIRINKGETVCGGELSADEYILVSPGYPTAKNRNSKYPPNLDCEWYVIGKGDTTAISFKFWNLKIEIGDNDSNETCEYDYVNISITSIGSRRYCGYKAPPDAIIGVGSLFVHFHSDGTSNYQGFQATYKIYQNFDPCEKNPCKNGDCKRTPNKLRAMCECFPGYSGITCEKNIDECLSEPCLNGATCSDRGGPNLYECICSPKWEGEQCHIEKSLPCSNNPCLHDGKCIENVETYTYKCNCSTGYVGINCETEIGCGNPGIPYLKKYKRFLDQTTLSFSCKSGYRLDGFGNITCINGNWSDVMPQCSEPNQSSTTVWQNAMIILGITTGICVFTFTLWMILRGPCVDPSFSSHQSANASISRNNVVNSVSSMVHEDLLDDVSSLSSHTCFY